MALIKGPGKVTQSNLVHHPTETDKYIGYVLRTGSQFRGYFFERPRALAMAVRVERNVLASPVIMRPKMASARFAMKVHYEAHMMTDPSHSKGLTTGAKQSKSSDT